MRFLPVLFVVLSGAVLPMRAQIQLLNVYSGKVVARIDLAAGQLTKAASSGDLGNIQLSLENGELSVSYQLPKPDNAKEYFQFKELTLSVDGLTYSLLPEQMIGNTGRIEKGGSQSLLLANLLDQFINLQGELVLSLAVEHWGEFNLPLGVDCNVQPTFSSRQRLPYYLAAGLGIAAIGTGQVFRSQSEDIYFNQYLEAASKADADPLYDRANGKHHTYLMLTYGGSALLVADVVLYFIRDGLYRRKLEYYQEYCNKTSLLIEPVLESPSLQAPGGRTGMRLTFNF